MRTLIATMTAALLGLLLVPAAGASLPNTGWELTVYATVLEANHPGGAPVTVYRCLNNDPSQGADTSFPLGTHPQEFVELTAASQQGSGRFLNRLVLMGFHYTAPGVGCGQLSDVPLTSSGVPAVAWATAAGGTDAFPTLGTTIKVTACGNASVPALCSTVTGAKWRVTDRRQSGQHIDLYIGDENVAAAFSSQNATIDTTPTGPAERLAGPDRIDTGVVTSQSRFGAGSAHAVVISRSDLFADALAGTPLAVTKVGPLLLTPPTGLDARTDFEIRRVLPTGGTVYLLGGPAALSDTIASAISAEGYNVVRLGGANRFETATIIANAIGTPKVIMVATGTNADDALVGGAAAAHMNGVVVLTNGSTMAPETAAYLGKYPSVQSFALGGPAAAADPSATAIVGTDRYDTSARVAHQFFGAPAFIGIASGTTFPDSLAGGAAAGDLGGPLLLATSPLPDSIHKYLTSDSQSAGRVDLFGGITALPEDVLTSVDTSVA